MKDREHEVFISYSSKNKNIADAIVADLEQNNIRCWYAPRDIYPGEDWAGTIKNAIESTKIFVLVFTDESNQSHQVTNEVTLAVNSGKIIIPFLLTGSNMNDTLLYYLSSVHWLDAVSQPLSTNIETLRKQISVLLNIDDADERKAAAARIAVQPDVGSERTHSPGSSGGSLRTGIVIGFLAAALAVCIAAFAFSRGDKQSADAGTVAGTAGQIAEESDAEEAKAEVEPATVEEKAGDQKAEEQPAAEPNAEEQTAAEPAAETEEAEKAEAAKAEASEQKESQPESE